MARPRAENYLEKQQLILDQAAVLFAKKGFAGTSMATIAKFCNTSKALIYHYYQAKEALLFDMLYDHVNKLLEAGLKATEEVAEPEQQVRHLLSVFMNIYVSSHAKHIVLLNDLHWLPENQQKEIKEIERQVVKIFRDLVAKLRPDLDENTCLGLSMSLLGTINWTYIWFKEAGALSPAEFADIAASLFFGGVKAVQSPVI